MSNQDTTHTIRYEQPGVLSALPYNKVAQFALGLVMLIVVWKAYWAGWFSMFAYTHWFDSPMPPEGMGSPIGLIPFAIDAVCLVGLSGFALIGIIRGAIGPLFGGLHEWLATFRAERAASNSASTAAVSTDIVGESGRTLTMEQVVQSLQLQIHALSEKLEDKISNPPDLESTLQRVVEEKIEADKRLAMIQETAGQVNAAPAVKTTAKATTARKTTARKTGTAK